MRIHPIVLALAVALGAAPLAAQVPPDADWRSFATEHFRVTFVEGLEPVARRVGERAESAYSLLSRELVRPPRGRIDLVVADNVDLANGYATPFPTNRIVVYAHPPVDEPTLAFNDDWIELVVLHELVHIFHLDHAGGIWRPLRSVFGRSPALFPEVYAPAWVVEGLATYYESALTRGGRVRGTYHDMALRAAVLEGSFFPVDRATGGPTTWPGGSTPYIYGSLFIDFLARRHGPESVSRFVESVGRRLVPYRLDAAAKGAFGTSFTRAWSEWEDSLRAGYLPLADSLRAEGVTEPEVLTTAGRIALHPRYAPDGSALAYSASNGREVPSLRLILPDGSEREVVERTTLGPATWSPDGQRLLFSQLEYLDPYRIYADLYRADPAGGSEERLTRGARFWEVDLHPDGRRVVGVTDARGTNALEVRDLESGERRTLAEASLGTAWSLPRWSPDGERIAVSRWRAGGEYDVVVLDAEGRVLQEATADRAVDLAPSWSPDGRFVLFSSDRTGIPDLYAFDTREARLLRVTRVLTGAFQPSVSPDGRWIAFAYYRADGYHVARIPYAPERWWPAPPVRAAVAGEAALPDFAATAGGEARPYSPWRSLAPAAWSPAFDAGTELGPGVGAAASGVDLVERHLWGVAAVVYPDGGRLEGGAAYRYRGWGNPVLDLSLSQDWSVYRKAGGRVSGRPDPLATAILSREREAAASLSWLRSRWRSSSWVRVGAELLDLERAWDDSEASGGLSLTRFPPDLGTVLEAGYASTRGTAFSLGPQEGVRVSGTLEGHRYAEPFEGEREARGYLRATGRGRAFRDLPFPGFARHVAALRLEVGVESGSVSPGFGIGGASGGSAPVAVDLEVLGGGLAFPVRGYAEGVQVGNRAVSASAEYRFPLLRVERGFRLLPVYLDRVWGDLFLDAGAAWCPGSCERGFRAAPSEPRPLASVGAELNVETTFGFFVGLPLRFGVALPLRDPGVGRPGLHLRIGRSF